ncbi:MAG: DUF4065 domain-containing protein [Emergencia sp.]|nr:DUF4065 domain-containing protein [Emergencia sp.]
MKVIETKMRLCASCMEEHPVQVVRVEEENRFKGETIQYEGCYWYCNRSDEFYADERMMSTNDQAMKDTYRRKKGLLTAEDIIAIRGKYSIMQTDFCVLLGWGAKTITRYEGHQVQDQAHDSILRKIDQDPEWFLSLLNSAKHLLPQEAYQKYQAAGLREFEKNRDIYLQKAILASYAHYTDNLSYNGGAELSLEKVAQAIRYFVNSGQVTSLYKIKLMKLLWYADALSYKRRNFAMTGLVYRALPMGAVPIGHGAIIGLSGVHYEEIEIGAGIVYKFLPTENRDYSLLTVDDLDILDTVIQHFGKKSKDEIVESMRREEAYKKTKIREIIRYDDTKSLSIE